jgi:signal transduction histidine kinase
VACRKLRQYPLGVAVGACVESALERHADRRRDDLAGAGVSTWFIGMGFALLGGLMIRQRRAALLLQEATRQPESANRVKPDFIAAMTHELRTPLDGIIGFAVCLQEALQDENRRECAWIIHASGCTLSGI